MSSARRLGLVLLATLAGATAPGQAHRQKPLATAPAPAIVFLGSQPEAGRAVAVRPTAGVLALDLTLSLELRSPRALRGTLWLELVDAGGVRCAVDVLPDLTLPGGLPVPVVSQGPLLLREPACQARTGGVTHRLRALLKEAEPGGAWLATAVFPVGWPISPRQPAATNPQE